MKNETGIFFFPGELMQFTPELILNEFEPTQQVLIAQRRGAIEGMCHGMTVVEQNSVFQLHLSSRDSSGTLVLTQGRPKVCKVKKKGKILKTTHKNSFKVHDWWINIQKAPRSIGLCAVFQLWDVGLAER